MKAFNANASSIKGSILKGINNTDLLFKVALLAVALVGAYSSFSRSASESSAYKATLAANENRAAQVALTAFYECSRRWFPDLADCEVSAVNLVESRGLPRKDASQAIVQYRAFVDE